MEQRVLGDSESCYVSQSASPGSVFRSPYIYYPSPSHAAAAAAQTVCVQSPGVFMGSETLDSSFSRLGMWPDHQRPRTPPPMVPFPTTADVASGIVTDPNMSYYYSRNSERGKGVNNVGFQQQGSATTSIGVQSIGQDLGFCGTQMESMVGPAGSCVFWAGPSCSNGDVCWDCCRENLSLNVPAELDNNGHHLGIYDNAYSSLQSKQPLPRSMNHRFQNLLYPDQDFEPFEYPQPPLTSSDLTLKYSNSFDKSFYSRPSGASKQYQSLSFLDFKGKIVALAKDENWSRIFQEILDNNRNEQEIELVLSEVKYNVAELMKDQFGSHFMHKFFAVCSEEQRTSIIVSVTRDLELFISICLNPNGAKIMPKLLENLSTPEQIFFVMSAVRPEVVRLSTDPNGQHVLRYCLRNFSHEYIKNLLIEIKNNCLYIATDKSGCCLLQCCLDCAQGDFKEQLISEIIRNSLQLAKDPYGNYVIQYLLGKKEAEKADEIMRRLQGHFVSLSRNKHGSHVVEKFLIEGEKEEHTNRIIFELLTTPNAANILLDPFGNFVIQRALSVAKGPFYSALCRLVQVNASSMRSNLYGRKVLTSFEKRKSQNVDI